MQRLTFLIVYFFVSTGSFTQPASSGGQYPFVHYTPKDGLISNSIRSIYQDSKGRLYFTSINGLSVYDGSRFINYTSKNGLDNDIVNCVMEMGDDSVWVVTNVGKIQCLVNGKLKPVILKDPPQLIDNLIHDEKGILYAASEQGLFRFQDNRFIKLPFIDVKGKDVGTLIGNIYPVGQYLFVVRDNSLVKTEERYVLYLYEKDRERIIAQTGKEIIHFISKAPDGRIWASTGKNILAIDTIELKKGKIVFQELPAAFERIKKSNLIVISFDLLGNCWLTDKVSVLKKVSPDGNEISFTTASGLNTMDISHAFLDKEETIWIATFGGGVSKLVHSNFSYLPDVFGVSAINSISYAADKKQMYIYSPYNAKVIMIGKNNLPQVFEVNNASKFQQLFRTPKGIFGISGHAIYKISASGNKLYPKVIFTDTIDYTITNPLIDKNGNFIFGGRNFLTAVLDGKLIYRKRINSYFDHAALDTNGNIWTASRTGEIIMYQPQTDNLSNYLEKEIVITGNLGDNSPRSIVIDKNNTIWIGTRNDGIHAFKLENGSLVRQFFLNSEKGLSDNFITHLACDADNNIWASSPSGLDKVTLKNDIPVIENMTKQNNIYQKVISVVFDKNNVAWGLLQNGLIKMTPENKKPTAYSPVLMVSMMKAGNDTITNMTGALSYKQNNLSFYFAATSFLDEKQVLYNYRLHGGSNTQWSEPSNNATVSLIDLPPGDYTLDIKANFPAGRYPEQIIHYKFSIAPPWWQTWWFRLAAGLLIIGLLMIAIWYYYRRKLEKQQAIEKERTRIATDMHDDLGAGLSRIKFLSQALSNKEVPDESIKTGLEKITGYSDEMAEKMGEIVWALNEKNDTLADLIAYTRTYSLEYLANHNISCKMNTPMHLPGTFIAGEIRRNIFLTVKECLHNIVKHAAATQVNFSIQLNGRIEIVIHDNGKGIDWDNQRAFSNGIENIKKRMSDLNGKAEFLNEQGTKVVLQIPLRL